MTKRYSGILITENEGLTTLKRVEADTFRELQEGTGLEYFERVHGQHTRINGVVGLVDEDGFAKNLRINRTGNKVIGYPGILVGPVFITSEGYVKDGMDFLPLTYFGELWIKKALYIDPGVALPQKNGDSAAYGDLLGRSAAVRVALGDAGERSKADADAEEFLRDHPETD